MVNHGPSWPLFFIIALLAETRRGLGRPPRPRRPGVPRAVLATLFLIVAFATLAMPGSANFVGEFLILLGVFKAKLAIAIIAFSGVVMASVYALRLFIGAMHNRVRDGVDPEIGLLDSAVLVPLVAVILFFAVYPQLALQRSEGSVKAAVATSAASSPFAAAARMDQLVARMDRLIAVRSGIRQTRMRCMAASWHYHRGPSMIRPPSLHGHRPPQRAARRLRRRSRR